MEAIPRELERPQLDLSGPLLAEAFQLLAKGSEAHGGVERYIEALKLKAALFQDTLGSGKVAELDLHDFIGLCAFMATVRRRVSPYLGRDGFANIQGGLAELLSGMSNTVDRRMSAFRLFARAFPKTTRIASSATWRLKSCTTSIRSVIP